MGGEVERLGSRGDTKDMVNIVSKSRNKVSVGEPVEGSYREEETLCCFSCLLVLCTGSVSAVEEKK